MAIAVFCRLNHGEGIASDGIMARGFSGRSQVAIGGLRIVGAMACRRGIDEAGGGIARYYLVVSRIEYHVPLLL